MSYHGVEEFAKMKKHLAQAFVATAEQFASNCGLGQLSEEPLRQMSTSIEETAAEVLMFGCDAWPDTARAEKAAVPYPFEICPSQVDPPKCSTTRCLAWTLASFLLTIPLALIIHGSTGTGAYFCFGIGVIVAAIVFGSPYALVLSGLSPVVDDLLIRPPLFTLDLTENMVIMGAFYVAISLGVPWLVRWTRNHHRPLAMSRSR